MEAGMRRCRTGAAIYWFGWWCLLTATCRGSLAKLSQSISQSVLSEAAGGEEKGEGPIMVFRCCCDIEHPEHVDPTSSQDRCVFSPYTSKSVCVYVCVRECTHVRVRLLVRTYRKVSGCGACMWGVNALAPSHHLKGAREGWRCVRRFVRV